MTNHVSVNNENSQWPSISRIAQAHQKGIKGQGILMGVLDTGVDADHPEFLGHIIKYRYIDPASKNDLNDHEVRGFDPDRRNHGTQVCGVIAGKTIGIAPEVELYVASVIESETIRTNFRRVMRGLDWLLDQFQSVENKHKPAIVNLSLSFALPSESEFKPLPDIGTRNLLKSLIDDLHQKILKLKEANVLVVASIGNTGQGKFNYPGAFKEVFGVGAVDFQGKLATFSGSGQPNANLFKPDGVGYGVDVHTSFNRDCQGNCAYQKASGTTIAAAYVAGIAALYRCQFPHLTVDEITYKIIQNASSINHPIKEDVGVGLVRFI